MAENLVERVARAICQSDGRCFRREVFRDPCIDPETHANAPCRATREQLLLSWRWDAAKAAIAALREPTDAMLEEGPPEPYMDRDVWRRMIDAALGEG